MLFRSPKGIDEIICTYNISPLSATLLIGAATNAEVRSGLIKIGEDDANAWIEKNMKKDEEKKEQES